VLAGVATADVAGRGLEAIVFDMASVATVPDPAPIPPPSDPQAIRACLTPTLAAEFDREWEVVLDRVKQSKDLADLHELLNKWRHIAYAEMRDPGLYYRMLSKAEQILRAGGNPDAVPFEEMQALVHQRRVR
jgi:hypothetical protein